MNASPTIRKPVLWKRILVGGILSALLGFVGTRILVAWNPHAWPNPIPMLCLGLAYPAELLTYTLGMDIPYESLPYIAFPFWFLVGMVILFFRSQNPSAIRYWLLMYAIFTILGLSS